MTVVRLQHVSVAVPHGRVEECATWYADVLGMERIPNLAGLAWLRFGDGDHVHLLGGEPRLRARTSRSRSTTSRAPSSGAVGPPGAGERGADLWGAQRWFTHDPAGNMIELFEPTPELDRRGRKAVRARRVSPLLRRSLAGDAPPPCAPVA